jgi:hypothetical protein
VSGPAADELRKRKWRAVRKWFSAVSFGVPTVCLAAAACVVGAPLQPATGKGAHTSGSDEVLLGLLVTAALAGLAVQHGGWRVNHLDIGPRYAGELLGLTSMAGSIAGMLAVLAVSEIVTCSRCTSDVHVCAQPGSPARVIGVNTTCWAPLHAADPHLDDIFSNGASVGGGGGTTVGMLGGGTTVGMLASVMMAPGCSNATNAGGGRQVCSLESAGEQWSYILWTCAAMCLAGLAVFSVAGSAALQSWNTPEDGRYIKWASKAVWRAILSST